MFFLGKVRRQSDGLTARGFVRAAEGQAADLTRGGNVTLEQSGRELADRHIVETVAGVIGRQQRRHIYFEREQVANRIPVFGAIQTPESRRTPGVRMRRRGAVERRFERR